MPDISKCFGVNCPIKETCYRYTCKPSGYRQPYTDYTKRLNKEKDYCEARLKIKK